MAWFWLVVGPVLAGKAGDALGVAQVAGNDGGAFFQSDGGDAQVVGADAESEGAQGVISVDDAHAVPRQVGEGVCVRRFIRSQVFVGLPPSGAGLVVGLAFVDYMVFDYSTRRREAATG